MPSLLRSSRPYTTPTIPLPSSNISERLLVRHCSASALRSACCSCLTDSHDILNVIHVNDYSLSLDKRVFPSLTSLYPVLTYPFHRLRSFICVMSWLSKRPPKLSLRTSLAGEPLGPRCSLPTLYALLTSHLIPWNPLYINWASHFL